MSLRSAIICSMAYPFIFNGYYTLHCYQHLPKGVPQTICFIELLLCASSFNIICWFFCRIIFCQNFSDIKTDISALTHINNRGIAFSLFAGGRFSARIKWSAAKQKARIQRIQDMQTREFKSTQGKVEIDKRVAMQIRQVS